MNAASYRPSLDGVRAVAIVLVMAEHAQVGLARAGGLGVDVFFVLSGFLITGLLAAEHQRAGRIRFGAFYLRRATRLYPALLALVTVGAAVVAAEQDTPLRTLVKAGLIAGAYLTDLFTFGHSSAWALWGHTWSLAVEEHFYLLWPPVLLLLLHRGSLRTARRWALAGAVVGALVAVVSAVPGPAGPPSIYFQPQTHAGGLLLGCAVALVPHRPLWTRRLAAPALALLLLLVVASPSPVHARYFEVSLPLVWVLTAALLVGLEHPSRTAALLGWNPWRLVGLVSYGLYLYHQVVFLVVREHLHAGRHTVIAVQMLLSLAVAAASYRWLEAPIRRWGRERAGRGAAAEAAPVAAPTPAG
jgi:peptidoglycan/LPS O-acetylase OafA/YrhL